MQPQVSLSSEPGSREQFATVMGPTSVYTTTTIGDPYQTQGTAINEYSVLTLPAFWRGIVFLSSTLAGLPKGIYKRERSIRLPQDHYLDSLLNDEINEFCNPFTFWQTLYHHAIDWGNGYAYIDRDLSTGRVNGMYNLPPDRVTPFRFNGKQWYSVDVGEDQRRAVAAADMYHLPGLGFDGMQGYPVVQLMAQALRIGKAAESFADKFLTGGATGVGAIETDKALTSEQIDQLRDAIEKKHTGIDNAHKWIILAHGLKAKPFTMSPQTSQLTETRTFTIHDISRILGVPPHLLYDLGDAKWANVEQMSIEVVKYSLNQWIIPSEQEGRRKLFTAEEKAAGYYVKYSVDALQRGDHVQQVDSALKRSGNGLTTVDEERALWDLPPHPEGIGSTPRVPANTVALGQQPAAPEAPAPQLPQPQAEEQQAKAPAVALAKFAALIQAAAERVHAKTTKAAENAKAKLGATPGWVPWCNTFADEQGRYAAANLGPILATYATVAGRELDHSAHADRIGQHYAASLRGHLYAYGKGEASTAPDLGRITFEIGGE